MSPAQERTSRTRQSACKTRHLVGLKSAALSGRKRVACSTRVFNGRHWSMTWEPITH